MINLTQQRSVVADDEHQMIQSLEPAHSMR